jgi:hypothetical protein
VEGERLSADAQFGGGAWRVDGAFEAGELKDPSLPGAVTSIAGRWSAVPEGDGVVIRAEAGQAFVSARQAPVDAVDRRPLFNPVRLANVSAELRDGQLTGAGQVRLDSDGHQLARFDAAHDIAGGVGSAEIVADNLVFDETLQPFEISELARGVFENVRGPASATANASWTRTEFRLTGMVRPNGLSLAMATIPVIRDVRGEVFFSDLLTLTTAPGQTVTIAELNPGIAVRNGRVRFQLLPNQQVSIEQAEFDFAGGVLAVAPTTIALGAEETRLNLDLRDLDVSALVTQLNAPDLQATGRVEGSFPVRLTARTAFIENGELRAAAEGGTIAYVGAAGENVTGTARVAFDALRSFRYDDLRLTLDGDLSGEIVSSISFRGRNTGRPVDLSPIADSPLGAVNARGVPFVFNVRITAPFRQLARTAAGIFDPGQILDATANGHAQENSPADTPPSVDVQVEPLR